MSQAQQSKATSGSAQKAPDGKKPTASAAAPAVKAAVAGQTKPASSLTNGPTKSGVKVESKVPPSTSKEPSANASKTPAGDEKAGLEVGENAAAKKKSSFQITKVVDVANDLNDTKELDATDDMDDGNTDDLSSDVADTPRTSEGDKGTKATSKSFFDDTVLNKNAASKQTSTSTAIGPSNISMTPNKRKDTQSRFKIVKIESKDHSKRGRWICFDFADPLGSRKSPKSPSVTSDRGVDGATNVSTADPIYYFPSVESHHGKSPFAPAIVYNEGHPVLERNPLEFPYSSQQAQFFQGAEWLSSNLDTPSSEQNGTLQQLDKRLSASVSTTDASMLSKTADQQDQLPLPSPRSNAEFFSLLSRTSSQQGSPLLAMVSSLNPQASNDENDESSNSNVAIDNKIEQAMDLVKSHLMFAVREEVEILKEQIKELLAKNSQLEYENKILRADATDETLAKLKSNTIM